MNDPGKRRHGQKGFTLAELIMAIALLAVFSTIIVQVFAQAQKITRKAETLDLAVNCASDLADQWKAADSSGLPEVVDLWQNRQDGRRAVVYLDDSFRPCAPQAAAWQADLAIRSGDETDFWLLTIDIGPIAQGTSAIFSLQAGHYWPADGGGP